MRTILAAILLLFIAAPPALAQDGNRAAAQQTAAPAETNQTAAPSDADETTSNSSNAGGNDGNGDDSIVGDSGAALLKLFVLAVLLESALALLFNWRPFVALFNGRGVKPMFSFGAALFIVFTLEPATVATLLAEYRGGPLRPSDRDIAFILEAMILAGGSSGVNRLLVGLGFRSRVPTEQVVQAPKNEAWLSVGLRRTNAVGPVEVELQEGANLRLLGIIGQVPRPGRILSWFINDYGRIPPSGGYSVTPGTSYLIRLKGKDSSGAPIRSPDWGPHALADRAVVDIELEL